MANYKPHMGGQGDALKYRIESGNFSGTGGSDTNYIGKAIGFETDPFGTVSDVYHGITGTPTASAKREAAAQANAQIQAYKDQTELTRTALNDAKAERERERKRVEEKQIRGLRNRSGRGGLMSSQSNTPSLGNSSELPNKLGTA